MSQHAVLSPSSAARWMACPGSIRQCEGLPDSSSSFADEGTAAHELAAICLRDGSEPREHLGVGIAVNGQVFTVDQEMALAVGDYVSYVRDLVRATEGGLLVEQRLSIGHLTGEAGARGTSDVVIIARTELIVVDLKYGRGVAVEADDNPQLAIYGAAALEEFGLAQDFERVRMVIHQPRLGAVSEWVQTTEEMADFAEQVREAAEFTRHADAPLVATDKGCRFCRAKGTCPALADHVQAAVGADFDNLTTFNREMTEVALRNKPARLDAEQLATAMAASDLVEIWLKAVRAEVESRLLAGQAVAGFKLVQGKRGARRWADEKAAEELLKAMRVKHDQMYDYSVISPTSAEKLAKAEVIGPRQWPKVQALITQPKGKPSVAPESDKRPALVMSAVADDFQDVTTSDPVSDLA